MSLWRHGFPICVLVALGLLSGCGGDDGGSSQSSLDRARENRTVRIAVTNEPPYSIVNADSVDGMYPDTIEAVMKRLNVPEVSGVVSSYDGQIPGLQARRWDMIGAGLFLTEDRCKEILYSQPISVAGPALAVANGNPKNIQSYGDFVDNKDLKLVIVPAQSEEQHARKLGVGEDQFVQASDVPSGIEAVIAGRGDAFAVTYDSAEAIKSDRFDLVRADDGPSQAGAVAFRREDKAFRDAFDRALEAIKANGTFERLSSKYGFDAKLAMTTTRTDIAANCR
jgi:polar amino acid transport system substrate-binding protein